MCPSNSAKKIGITDTTLRDAHQSLLATRLRLQDMLPMVPVLDRVGFRSVEVWGGATFDACLRFLNEDPWERLRRLKEGFKETPLQMLLRGQNLLGYRHYPDDVVEAFVKAAVKNGVSIIRVFDALNDPRNMHKVIATAREAGAHVQATVCYTISPVHDIDHFVALARELKSLGADSLCLKDMAGILTPYKAAEIVKAWKDATGMFVQVHCHFTSGMADMTYLKAIEAGADAVDCAVSPLSMGTSQPPVESLVAALEGTPYDPGLDTKALAEAAQYFAELREKYKEFDKTSHIPDTQVLRYQIPGGMISNFISQLRDIGQLDKLEEVLEEVPRVRKDMGYPPLVTPTSQMVGAQALLNVVAGGRYRMVSNEVREYFLGLYGRAPGEVSAEVRALVTGGQEPVTVRPADLLEPGMEKARAEIGHLAKKEEDVISYAIFPQQTRAFLESRTGVQRKTRKAGREPEDEVAYAPV